MQNIFDVIRMNRNMNSLMKCVKATELENKLNRPGLFYTVFAPSEIAFGNLHEMELEGWLKDKSKSKLLNILYNHIVEGEFSMENLPRGRRLTTISGTILQIDKHDGDTYINKANIKEQDNKTSNGIIYLVDKIFMS